jgi:hypothetical protein
MRRYLSVILAKARISILKRYPIRSGMTGKEKLSFHTVIAGYDRQSREEKDAFSPDSSVKPRMTGEKGYDRKGKNDINLIKSNT